MAWYYNNHSGEEHHATNPVDNAVYALSTHTGTGWHAYPTEAALLADVKRHHWPAPTTSIGKGLANEGAGAARTAANAAGSVLGLPTFSNLRNLVIRSVKVIAGLLLIAIGTVKLFHVEQAVKEVAPIVAKGAAIA